MQIKQKCKLLVLDINSIGVCNCNYMQLTAPRYGYYFVAVCGALDLRGY